HIYQNLGARSSIYLEEFLLLRAEKEIRTDSLVRIECTIKFPNQGQGGKMENWKGIFYGNRSSPTDWRDVYLINTPN
ncbi:hypothetical protein CN643_17085, partial [Parageobacillus yumthangensis]